MVLQQRIINSNASFIKFKGNMIQHVLEYTFLGSFIKSNGNFNHSLMGNLPSSALTPIFEDVFLAPKVNLQKFK
jgi:hypothetical protein